MSTTALAPLPNRATTSFTLTWGLVSMPLSVYTGTEETRVKRSEYVEIDGTDIPVGRAAIRKDTGEVIDSAVVVRKAQATNGNWVALSDDEVADCTSVERGVGEIVAFVPVKHVANYVTETVNQVRPKATKGKPDPSADKAFALLRAAMRKRKVVALVKVALRGPARYALLDAEGTLSLVRTHDAIREALPLSVHTFNDAELGMALNLIDAVGVEAPILTDDTAPVVQSFVDAKAGGVTAPPAATPPPTIDIMAALEASITASKKSKRGAA